MVEHGLTSKPKTLPKYIRQEEILSILDKAKKDSYRNYILLLVLSRTGMRVSELIKLRKMDLNDSVLYVRQGKGKKDRVIPLERELSNILGLYTDRLNPKDYLFSISDFSISHFIQNLQGYP